MKRSTVIISGISRAAFSAAVFCAFEVFFALITEVQGALISPVWPFIGLGIVYIFGRVAAARGMKPLVYTGFVILIAAAEIAALQLLFDVPGNVLRFRVLMGLCFAICAAVMAKGAVSESSPAVYTHRFDACLIVLLLMILAGHYLEIKAVPSAMAMSLAALVLLLAAIIALRTENNGAAGNRAGALIPTALFIVVIIAALLIGAFGSSGAGSAAAGIVSGIKAVFSATGAGLAFLWGRWKALCAWIATLFAPDEYVPENIIEPDIPPDLPEPSELTRASIIVFYILTALLIAAVLFAIIRVLSRARFKRSSRIREENRAALRTGGFWSAVKELLGAVRLKLSYRAACVRHRMTPAGLLAWCEAKNRRKMKKLPSESGEAYLKRLAACCSGDDCAALTELAGLVERSFYSRDGASVDARLYKAVRSCSFVPENRSRPDQ